MGTLKMLINFYLRSSLHVAFCFLALFLVVNYRSVVDIQVPALVLLFCGALLGYNMIKYGQLLVQQKSFAFQKPILLLSSLLLVVATWLFFTESFLGQLVLAAAGLLGVLYAFPLFRHRNWRQLPLIKLVVVALSWALIIFWYPAYSDLMQYDYTDNFPWITQLNNEFWMKWCDFIQLMLLIFTWCIPFEIRDLKYDAVHLRTIPQMMGTKNAKRLGLLLCLLYLVLELLQVGFTNDIITYISYMIIGITGVAIWLSDVIKTDYYASFFVEAIPVLWLGVVYLVAG